MLQYWLENTTAKVKLLTSPTLQVKPSSKPDGSESIPDIYEPFIKFCQTQNSIASRVFDLEFRAVGYIWTQSNLASARGIFLKTYEIMTEQVGLDGAPTYEGFVYVTHSMGALAGRAALKLTKYCDSDL
jgi:hypothetical protein